MSAGPNPVVGEALPHDVWDSLSQDANAVLVDVRSAAEWAFVGVPDLSDLGRAPIQVEWASFPEMSRNVDFAQQVLDALGGAAPSQAFFICRSGARSLSAAQTMAQAFAERGESVVCVNVTEGFEGDLNDEKHRGTRCGWKARGLSWVQS